MGTSGAGDPAALLPQRAKWVPLGVLVVFVVIGLARMNPSPPLAIVAAVVAAGAGALLFTSRRPLMLGYAALATSGIAVLGNGMSSNIGWFAVCLIGAWCALIGGPRVGLTYLAGVVVLFAAEWLWAQRDPGWGAWVTGTTLAVLAALLVRHEVDLVAQLRAAQAGLAERAKAEERNRIARELHDVIAHTLTICLLHVTSARLAVEYDPADAARALAEAERLGRESLTEVRSAVGLLRHDGTTGSTEPLPGVDQLPALVERFRAAHADVTLAIEGDAAQLPATTGLAVYRIAQEALTNAVKHARGAPIAVDLRVETNAVELIVDSAGKPGHGIGIGLLSMRERAESLGGCCVAGPGGRGWLVRASLPLDAAMHRQAVT